MVTIPKRKQIPPTTISVFLGLNESNDGDTELKLGEASRMENWRITDGMKLKRMEGYTPLFNSLGSGNINGMTVYNDTLIFAHGGNVYKKN